MGVGGLGAWWGLRRKLELWAGGGGSRVQGSAGVVTGVMARVGLYPSEVRCNIVEAIVLSSANPIVVKCNFV